MHGAGLLADLRQPQLRLAGLGDGVACVLLACRATAVRGHHPGPPARAQRQLQPDSPVGLDRFHLHRGRSRRAVRAPEPGCLPGDAAGYHARHRAVQLVGAQCPAGPSRTARRRGRLPRPVAPAGRAGVLPVRVPDAAVPWAVLHLPDPAPGIAGLQPGADRSALGAGGGCRGHVVPRHATPAATFQPAPGAGRELPAGVVALAASRQPGRQPGAAGLCPDAACRHLRQFSCGCHPFRAA